MKSNDNSITQTLAEISQTLVVLHKTLEQPNAESAAKLKTIANTLTNKITQLEPELTNYLGNTFSYEFYDNTSEIVEQISQLRLTVPKKKQLQELQLFDFLNKLVNLLRVAVYRHESLANTAIAAKPAPLTLSYDSLDVAKDNVNAATQRATAASAAAEKANVEGMKNLQKIQAEQKESGGLISPELFDQSIKHTVTMLALNTAAVLASDEAAVAITEMEDLVDKLSAAAKK